ncbi:MAG: radical SAM protein [Myxococcota bacterium]
MTRQQTLRQKISRTLRTTRMVVRGLTDTQHPVLAHIIPIRRCNLSCTYCNEYDQVSDPVPTQEMIRRIDHLAKLGTSIVVCSGGEPLMHPDLDRIIARIRSHKMVAGLITNGFYLSPGRIRDLNAAGLDYVQISIDGVKPTEVSVKCLRTLDKKLQHLSEHAAFHVNINSVLGGGTPPPISAPLPNVLKSLVFQPPWALFTTRMGF